MNELWKPIPGFEGKYDASDLGRVRSIPRRRTQGGILGPTKNTAGYLQLTLIGANGTRSTCMVHRLVLLTHVGPCPEGMEAAHENGDRSDNRVGNLRWTTRRENIDDRIQHGAHRRVMREKRKLSPSEAAYIRSMHKVIKQTDLAEMFGVHRATIQRIHSGEQDAPTAAEARAALKDHRKAQAHD